MIAAMAVAAGAAFAETTPITSANVVGYENIEQNLGEQQIRGVQFSVVNGDPINLQDIKVYAGDEVAGYDSFTMWWWDSVNSKNVVAIWNDQCYDPNDPTADGDGIVYGNCWTTRSDDDPTELEAEYKYNDASFGPEVKETKMNPTVTFKPGQAFFMKPGCDDPKAVISGEVLQVADTEVTKSFEAGFLRLGEQMMVCNPFPGELALQKIVAFAGEEVAGYDSFTMWWWDAVNSRNVVAIWNDQCYDPLDPTADGDGIVYGNCWTTRADDDPTELEGEYKYNDASFGPDLKGQKMNPTVAFEPGLGFWVKPGCDDPTLAFPNPFYKGE